MAVWHSDKKGGRMICEICKKNFKVLNLHLLKKHGITPQQYKEKYPNAELADRETLSAAGQQKRAPDFAKFIYDPEERKIFNETYLHYSKKYPECDPISVETLSYNELLLFRYKREYENNRRTKMEIEKLDTQLKRIEDTKEKVEGEKAKFEKDLPKEMRDKIEKDFAALPDEFFLSRGQDALEKFWLDNFAEFRKMSDCLTSGDLEKKKIGEKIYWGLMKKLTEKHCPPGTPVLNDFLEVFGYVK